MEDGTTTEVTVVDRTAVAEPLRTALVEEDGAEVGILLPVGAGISISGNTTSGAALAEGVRTAHNPRLRALTPDGFEVVRNWIIGVGSEICLVERIGGTTLVDVLGSVFGHGQAFPSACYKERILVWIRALVYRALLEAELALGDVVGDGNGDGIDGTGDGTAGSWDDFDGAVGLDESEPRDRVEGESSRATGREIIQGRHCQGVRLS